MSKENTHLQIQCTVTAEKIQSARLEFEQMTKDNARLFLEKIKKGYNPIGYFLAKVCMVLCLLVALYILGKDFYYYLNGVPDCFTGMTVVNCGIILLISLSFLLKDTFIGKAVYNKYISKVASVQTVQSFKSLEQEFLPFVAVYTFNDCQFRYERQLGEAKKRMLEKSFVVDYFAVGEEIVLLFQHKKSLYPQQIMFVDSVSKPLLINYLENLGFNNTADFLA